MFKITIEETKMVLRVVGKVWDTVDTEEVPREETFYRERDDEPRTRIKEVRGYTPQIEKLVEEKSTVLTQEVQELDLAKVIKAINNL